MFPRKITELFTELTLYRCVVRDHTMRSKIVWFWTYATLWRMVMAAQFTFIGPRHNMEQIQYEVMILYIKMKNPEILFSKIFVGFT